MRLLAVVLLVFNAVAVVSAFYVLRTTADDHFPSADSEATMVPMARLRRSGILFGKLARGWVSDDKRNVLRPLVEYEPGSWY